MADSIIRSRDIDISGDGSVRLVQWGAETAAEAWVTLTLYHVNDYVNNAGNLYICITQGTSGAGGPTTTAADITDGTAHWRYVSLYNGFSAENTYGSIYTNVQWADRSIQIAGTWNGATIVMQGSNDGSIWFNLKRAESMGNDVTLSANGILIPLELTRYVRPYLSVPGTDPSNLVVSMIARRVNTMRT